MYTIRLAAFVAFLFPAPCAAQALPLFPASPEIKAWPAGVPRSGAFGAAVAGHLTGTGHPDVVLLAGGEAFVFCTPAGHASPVQIPAAPPVTSIAARRAAPGASRGDLLLSDSDGLRFSTWQGGGPETGLIATSGWALAKALATADIDGDGLDDLVAIVADASTVRVAFGTPGGGFGTVHARAFADPVLAIGTVLWDSDAIREVVVVTAKGLHVCAADLAVPDDHFEPGMAATASVAAVRLQNGSEVIAWLSNTAGASAVRVLIPSPGGGTPTVAWIGLQSQDAIACVAGDVDADGDDDLLLSQRKNHRALVLVNRDPYPAVFAFTPADASEVALVDGASGTPAPQNAAAPVCADIDGDGDADLVHAVESTGDVTVVRSPAVPHQAVGVSPNHGTQTFDEVTQVVTVTFSLAYQPMVPAEATHVELLCWVAHNLGSASYRIDPLPVVTSRWLAGKVDVDVQLSAGPLFNSDAYLMWWRPVILDEDVLVHAYPPSAGAYATDPDVQGDMLNLTGAQPIVPVPNLGEDGGLGAGGYIGIEPPPPMGSGEGPGAGG